MIKQKLLDNLICLNCSKSLNLIGEKLVCSNCQKEYLVINSHIYFLEKKGEGFKELSSDAIINKLKVFFKKYPIIFNILYYTFGASVVGRSPKKAIQDLGEDKIILNLGSGIRLVRKDVINIDFYPFANVDIVADITKLPFKDNSVDAVVCESVLEHVKNPGIIIQEIKRILKPDGIVYLSVPFIAGFHSSPDDYYRWSKQGLRELMRQGFQEREMGIRSGPTSALISIINEWIAIILSFGLRPLHQILLMILTIITFPLKIPDYFIYKFSTSQNIAFGFYYIGRKK